MNYIEKLKEILTFNNKVFILPHYGEFGWFVLRYMKQVYLVESDEKIVCCKKGDECFFPSANSFFYDWDSNLSNHGKKGWHTSLEDKKKLVQRILREYKDYKIIDLGTIPIERTFNFDDYVSKIDVDFYHKLQKEVFDKVSFDLSPKLNDLKTDIVFGARYRNRSGYKNWKHWNELGVFLKDKGLSVSVVGLKEDSFFVENADIHAYDFDVPQSATIELIKNCKLFIGSDTGTTHLASFLGKNVVIVGYCDRHLFPIFNYNSKKNKSYFRNIMYDENSIFDDAGFNKILKLLDINYDK